MSRGMVAQARRDQAAAVLREAREPLRLRDIVVGGRLYFCPDAPGQVDCDSPYVDSDHWHERGEGGCYRVLPDGSARQADLDALLRDGLVTRAKVGRAVYWTWAGESIDMAEFEAALEVQR